MIKVFWDVILGVTGWDFGVRDYPPVRSKKQKRDSAPKGSFKAASFKPRKPRGKKNRESEQTFIAKIK